MVRNIRYVALALVALLVPIELAAQSATVMGTVRSQARAPVRGAAVTIPALNLGTVTNDAGDFRLVVPEGRVQGQQVTLNVSLIGYRSADVSITLTPGVIRQEITLTEEAIALDAVVVTGTAGRQARRAQAAVVSTIDAASVTEVAPVSSVQQLLQSRLPGVSVNQGGGTVGGTQIIRMRGQASISLSNEPLVFIDGVRADQRSTELHFTGGQERSRLNDIRPEDIEDIEIIKGPAASTLYGADASAGVIHIITKRGRQGAGFTQTISTEFHRLDWDHFTPTPNFGACAAAHVANPDHMYCAGQAVGTVVFDSPLERTDAIQVGGRQAVTWSGRGGGENHGYYVSLGGDQETGAFTNNYGENISGRANFEFQPTRNLRMDAGAGIARARSRFPDNDNNIYGWLGGAMLGSPLSAGHDVRDGWYGANRQNEAIHAIQNYNTNVRATPRLTVNYSPTGWLTNRLTFGADLSRVEERKFFPKNDNVWYAGVLNTGVMDQAREHYDRLTVDYMGNIATFLTPDISSDLSFGSQILHTRHDLTRAQGIGFTTNSANAINQAAQRSGGQSFAESRQLGFFGQWQLGYQDRLYLQLAGRVDQHSAFGVEADAFFSPKVGVSWVLSDEPFWQASMPDAIDALRLRAAWGTTGRAPTRGNIATYTSSPFALLTGGVGPGVLASDPGNVTLQPERGTELEAGFEAALFDDRVGLELTYFNKKATDVILSRPLPPSEGFGLNRLVNIGEVVNSGLEIATNARLVTMPDFGWEVRVGLSTLSSEVTDLGGIEPFVTGWSQEVREGFEPNAFFTRTTTDFVMDDSHPLAEHCPRSAGVLVPCGIVDAEPIHVGNFMPSFEGNVSQTFTFVRDLRLYALLDWKSNFMIYNNTAQFRERSFGIDEKFVRCGSTNPDVRNARNCTMSDEERIRRYGPFRVPVTDDDGNIVDYEPIIAGVVDEMYVEAGDFVRLREVSLQYALPRTFAQRFGASNASLTLGGRNLALWTDYSGPDPEIGLYIAFDRREDFLTLPPERRLFVRFNFQF